MNMAKKIFSSYKTYNFIDGKDPVIDQLRTLFADSGEKYSQVSERSGVSATTFYNWFEGETKKPQFCTIMAASRALGYDISFVKADKKASAKVAVFTPRNRAA